MWRLGADYFDRNPERFEPEGDSPRSFTRVEIGAFRGLNYNWGLFLQFPNTRPAVRFG